MNGTAIVTMTTWALAHCELPDADTDVLVYVEGDVEAQLGAYVGHSDLIFGDGGPEWVDAQGERITGRVLMWAPMPQPQWAAALALMDVNEQLTHPAPAAGAPFPPTQRNHT